MLWRKPSSTGSISPASKETVELVKFKFRPVVNPRSIAAIKKVAGASQSGFDSRQVAHSSLPLARGLHAILLIQKVKAPRIARGFEILDDVRQTPTMINPQGDCQQILASSNPGSGPTKRRRIPSGRRGFLARCGQARSEIRTKLICSPRWGLLPSRRGGR